MRQVENNRHSFNCNNNSDDSLIPADAKNKQEKPDEKADFVGRKRVYKLSQSEYNLWKNSNHDNSMDAAY